MNTQVIRLSTRSEKFRNTVAAWLRTRAAAFRKAQSNRRTQEMLVHLNEHLLEDIGLTRHDVEQLAPRLPSFMDLPEPGQK